MSAGSDFRAPIFYDTNNTAFYIDAAGTSVLSALTVGGNTALTTASTLTAGNLSGTIPSGVLGNSTHYVGTTAIALNRASASQTLTGVSIDGNAATVTNGVYTTGTQTIGGDKTFSNALTLSNGGTSARMLSGYTSLSSNDDWQNSPFSVRERDLIGLSSSANTYSPNLNFHWGSRVSNSLWMNSSGQLNWGSYDASGVPAVDGAFGAGNIYGNVFYDLGNTAYYVDPASTSNLNGLTVAGGNATIYRDLIVNGGASNPYGNRIIVQGTATTYTLQDSLLRPTIYLNGEYPVLTLNNTATTNSNHGPTIQFAFNGLTTGGSTSRQIVIGANGVGSWLDFGFSGGGYGTNSDYNPHNGISGYSGTTTMRIFSNGVLIGSTGAYPNNITSTSYALDVRGTGYSNTDFRSPIYYDSDNTGYYINAAGASSLNTLTMAGIITTVSSGTAINFSGQSDSFGYNATSGQGTYIKGTGSTYIYGGGVFFDGSAIRTLLHSNNYSGYSTFSGSVTSTYGNFTTPGLIMGDAQYGFYVVSGNVYYKSASGGVHYWRNIANNANTMSLDNSGILTVAGNLSAPIFYDSNDTAYYVDPNSVSRLASLRIYSAFDTASSDVYANMRVMRNNATTDGMYIGYGNSGTTAALTRIFGGGATTGELSKYSTYTLEPGSFRSPIFYDSDNTAYYIDAASTSVLNRFSLKKGEQPIDKVIRISGELDDKLDSPIKLMLKPFVKDDGKRNRAANIIKALVLLIAGILTNADISKSTTLVDAVKVYLPNSWQDVISIRSLPDLAAKAKALFI